MFETNIVIVGNVLTAPEWRRVGDSNRLVTNFRLASTARRYDRETGRWTDGNSLRVRVTAWRRLAEGVASSITIGDPVIVYGRIYTRDWVDEANNNRVSYEVEAFAVGHDLARGRSQFFRNKPAPADSTVEGPDTDALIDGEPSAVLPDDEIPVTFGDGLPERDPDDEGPTFQEVVAGIADQTAEPGDEPGTPETRPVRRVKRREPVAA